MPRQLSAEQVHDALPWQALAGALHAAFCAPPVAPPRQVHTLDTTGHTGSPDRLLLMPAWNAQYIGTKLVTVIPAAPAHSGHTVNATYLLLDRVTGTPCALLDGEALTVRRTAATSALAARHLAREDARTLLIVGSGRLAEWLARAHCALRPALTEVRVWGRNAHAATALAQRLAHDGLPAHAVQELPSAVASSDIVSCATTASEPIVLGAWLSPGTHLDLVGAYTPAMREVDDLAVQRSRVVVDDHDAALREAGDLLQPLAQGHITRAHIVADLATVLRGDAVVRRSAQDITLFKSVGLALEDLAAASLALHSHARPAS
jgi:ornithine cyclodeaminase